jgi:hypothetical protein
MADTQPLAIILSILAWLIDHAWHILFSLWALFVGFALYSIAIHLKEINNLLANQINWEQNREERYRK